MPLDPVKNFAKVQLSTGYASGVTSVVLVGSDGAKLPAPATDGAFNLVWYNDTDYKDPADDSSKEIVRCTARTTDTLTITRAQEGTADVNHNTGGKTYKMILTMTKKMKDDIPVLATNILNSTSAPSRVKDTDYQNTTGKTLLICVSVFCYGGSAANDYGGVSAQIGISSPPTTTVARVRTYKDQGYGNGPCPNTLFLSFVVPNNYYYKLTSEVASGGSGSSSIDTWVETTTT